ncbi:MAG: hypothetical protein H0W81_12905 [Chloroflexi bacterium]|nr:hypothetical protein [Chloroflexota bacterium]
MTWATPREPMNLPRRGIYGTECHSCYGRGVREMEEAVDRAGYGRHVELHGTFAERRRIAPPPEPIVLNPPREEPAQGSLFDVA